jgi:alpha-ribazole phosphatase
MEKKLTYLFKKEIFNLYIIRHPEVTNHTDNVFNGSVDVNLSDNGYKQADKLYNFFRDKSIGLVISSPLKRCKIVAEKFSGISEIIYDSRIKERNFGIFESLSWEAITKRYPCDASAFLCDPFNYRVKNGESFLDVEERVADFINDRLKNIGKNILIIAHGGVNRVFISHFLEMGSNSILKISQDYACVNHFQTDGEFILTKLINGQV